MRSSPGGSLMAEMPGQTRRAPLRAVVAGRLFGARWPLAALAACLLIAWGFGWLSAALAAIVFAVVFATAALAPRRPIRQVEPDRQGEDGQRRLEAISAADLASAVPDAILIFDGDGAALHANEAAVAAFGPFAPGFPLQRRFRAPEMQQLIDDMLSGADRKQRRRLCRAGADRARLPRHRHPHPRPTARCSCWSSRTRAKRAASTACAPISSPTPATNCARRWPRSPALSRRCAVRPATTPRRARAS